MVVIKEEGKKKKKDQGLDPQSHCPASLPEAPITVPSISRAHVNMRTQVAAGLCQTHLETFILYISRSVQNDTPVYGDYASLERAADPPRVCAHIRA